MLYFSAATRGFYDSKIHPVRPADAVEISAGLHQELLAAQGEGKTIGVDASGAPIAIDRPAPNAADALAALRRQRNQLLSASDRTQLLDAPITEAERADWATYRQALRDLPATIVNFDQVEWPTPPEQQRNIG